MTQVTFVRGERPSSPCNVIELLQLRARESPEKIAYSWLAEGEREERRLTYCELDRRACAIAARLGLLRSSGERALLLYNPGLDYIEGLFGCLYAGVVAVPTCVARSKRHAERLELIAKDSDASLILGPSSQLQLARTFFARQHRRGVDSLAIDDCVSDSSSKPLHFQLGQSFR